MVRLIQGVEFIRCGLSDGLSFSPQRLAFSFVPRTLKGLENTRFILVGSCERKNEDH